MGARIGGPHPENMTVRRQLALLPCTLCHAPSECWAAVVIIECRIEFRAYARARENWAVDVTAAIDRNSAIASRFQRP